MNFLTSGGRAFVNAVVVHFENPHEAVIQGNGISLLVSGDEDVERLWGRVFDECYPGADLSDQDGEWKRLWETIPLCPGCEERLEDGNEQELCPMCQMACDAADEERRANRGNL